MTTTEPRFVDSGLKQPHRPISRAQIEIVVSRSVAVFGLLFGAQTFPVMMGQADRLQPSWFLAMNVAIYGGLLFAVFASLAKRFVHQVNIYIALAYLVALAVWPLAVRADATPSEDRPWLWFLCTVATAAAAVPLRPWLATVYLFVAPIAYGLLRITPSGGGASWTLAALDAVYAIMLGGAVLVLITMLRQAAASVDAAQSAALVRYAHAVRQHATDVERVQVDSIVHDSVLTTLLSAARAWEPDTMALAARMSRNAIAQLQDSAESFPDTDSMVALEQLADRVAQASGMLSAPFQLHRDGVGAGSVPLQAAEAVYSASLQAMVNSLQHAGTEDVTRWVSIRGVPCGITVAVGDTGNGFDPDEVPIERLGLRVSIIERVVSAGGRVHVDSKPGEGTVVTIVWPDDERDPGVLDDPSLLDAAEEVES